VFSLNFLFQRLYIAGLRQNLLASLNIASALRQSDGTLTELDISRNPLSAEGARFILKSLEDIPNLTHLNLNSVDLGSSMHFFLIFHNLIPLFSFEEPHQALKKFLKSHSHLTYLNLGNNHMKALAELTPLKTHSKLQTLDLSGNKLSVKGG